MDEILSPLLDLIYPPSCPICQELIIPKGLKACEPCKDKLTIISEPRCKKCSKPIEQEEEEYCSDCEHKNFHYKYGYALWLYEKDIQKSIIRFKYHYKKKYVDLYTEEIISHLSSKIKKIGPDILAPVPIHWTKHRERGYNQAEILAHSIGKAMNIRVIPDLLVRNKKTLPQKQLSDKERLRNLQKAFEINEKVYSRMDGKLNKVLLIDDIYTTGSTIEACTNVLIRNGINNVYFLTLCIGKGF